jgi:hypothetical protein
MRLRSVCSAFSAIALAACASFASRPPLPDWAGPARAVLVRFAVSERDMLQVSEDQWTDQPGNGALAKSVAKSVRDTGWIAEKRFDEQSPRLDLHIANYQSDGPGVLVLFTGCLVPGLVHHKITLDASYQVGNGPPLSCSRDAEVTTWYQTFLIFAYPFASPPSGRAKVTDGLALQCVADLLKQADAAAAR